MMAARRHAIAPRIGFATRLPLPRNPPASDLSRLRRVLQVEDHRDVADVTFGSWRDVGVASVEIVAMYALAGGHPFADQLRRAGACHVIDRKPTAEILRPGFAVALVIDDHDAVGDANFMRMPALRDIHAREQARIFRIGDVHDAGAARVAHVTDIERGAVDPDLPAAGTIDMGDLLGVLRDGHWQNP